VVLASVLKTFDHRFNDKELSEDENIEPGSTDVLVKHREKVHFSVHVSLDIFQHASMFITAGSVYDTQEALMARVPIVAIPFSAEQVHTQSCTLSL
jgi:hypothetical protein